MPHTTPGGSRLQKQPIPRKQPQQISPTIQLPRLRNANILKGVISTEWRLIIALISILLKQLVKFHKSVQYIMNKDVNRK